MKTGLVITVMASLTGCAGYVGPAYVGEPYPDEYPYEYYGPYYTPGPDVLVYGGHPYHPYRPHYWHEYNHRGIEPHRAMAPHPTPHAGGFRGTVQGRGHGGSRGDHNR